MKRRIQPVYAFSVRRLQQVCVQIDDEKVVIHGDAPTYYTMQLAVAAASELFPDREIINAIEVI